MSLNTSVFLVPHFPVLLQEAGNGSTGPLHQALAETGNRLRAAGVEVVVMLSAVWDEEGPLQVDSGGRHKTLLDMAGVQGAELKYTCNGWSDMALALSENGLASGLPVEPVHRGMDHGCSVPISFLFPEADRRVVPLSLAIRSREQLRLWGRIVRETCRGVDATCALLVGGSLTCDPVAHLRGEDRSGGEELDRRVLELLEAGDFDGLAALPASLLESGAAQAGLRHLWFLEGAAGPGVTGEVLAYARHAAVGSALVEFSPAATD